MDVYRPVTPAPHNSSQPLAPHLAAHHVRHTMCTLSGQGWYYGMGTSVPTVERGYGYRYGKWKLAVGGYSCTSNDCKATMLYDLSTDLGEQNDIADEHPGIVEQIKAMMDQAQTPASFDRWRFEWEK